MVGEYKEGEGGDYEGRVMGSVDTSACGSELLISYYD